MNADQVGLVVGGLFAVALGIASLCRPHRVWRLQHALWVRGGQPSEFALVMIALQGAACLAVGVAMVVLGSGAGRH